MRNIAILGTGTTKFGERFESDYKDLLRESAEEAISDAGITKEDIDAAYLGTYLPYAWGFEGNAGTTITETLDIEGIPATRVANYCVTGMEAVRQGYNLIKAGEAEIVLAAGVEKMRDVPSRGSLVAQHIEKGHPFLCKGRTAPGMFALVATRYIHDFKAPRESLARVAVKNHFNGSLNPKAHFRKKISVEDVLNSPPVAEPLNLLDCTPTTDGGAALILVSEDMARESGKPYVVVKGIGLSAWGGYFTLQFDGRFDFLGFQATKIAASKAYEMAGIKNPSEEIDVVECHDCFTITEIVNYEDLGFAEKGDGWKLIMEGETELNGSLPVNPSGGLKSFGHPIGASGVRMINEINDQLLGRCGERQIKNASRGLAHTLGGPGIISCVFILERAG